MRIKYKVWCLTTAIIGIIVCADIYFGYHEIESSIRTELGRDAEDFRAIIMNDFIAKPVSVSLLYQKLCAWLQKQK